MNRIQFLGILCLAALLGGCAPKTADTDTLQVAVSILPLGDFVQAVAGDRVAVTVMIPPGAFPHSYEPKPEQMREMSRAAMYVKVGSPIEFELVWLEKLLSIHPSIPVVNAGQGIDLMPMESGPTDDHHTQRRLDSHSWLSVANAKLMVENILAGLIAIDPAHQEAYRRNAEQYIARLDALDEQIEQQLADKRNRKFLVYHPAWGYFARDYDLEQIPVEQAGKVPTAKNIQHLIETARREGITVIFVSPQMSADQADVIAAEIGGRVISVDPLAQNYIDNLEQVAQIMATTME